MPLHDHFHSPWRDENHWEGFHSAWVNTIVRHLNGSMLPPQYRAVPQVHLGAWVEADVAAFEKDSEAGQASSGEPGGSAIALWAPPAPVQTLVADSLNQESYEVQVLDESRGGRLVGVIELVSPGNKDRAEKVKAFVSKCAAYLRQQIGLIMVDVVTTRKINLHKELIELVCDNSIVNGLADLYAVAYRTRVGDAHWQLDTWPGSIQVGRPLPTLPFCLGHDFAVPLDLERSYQETCQVLRIP
jgi:hypothetical protein